MKPSISTGSAAYHPLSVLLHWVLAVAIVALFGLGLYMADLPFSLQRLQYYNWHKWGGVLVLALSVWRLAWRLLYRPPALPVAITQAMPAWQRVAHVAVQHSMYLLFFAVPLLGWAYSSAAGFPVVLMGVWPLPDWVPHSASLAEVLKPVHKGAAWLLMLLALGHAAAALKHACVDRDGLLQRMSFRR